MNEETKTKITYGAIIAIVIGVVAALALSHPWSMKGDIVNNSGIASSTFTYAKGNFSLDLFAGWSLASSSVALPPGFSGEKFALVKSGTTCVLAYAELPERLPTSYKQSTPGERVYVGGSQIDEWWWVPEANLPAGYKPKFEGREPFLGEVRVGTAQFIAPTSYGLANFLLYSEGGAIVPTVCESESTQMLKSFRPYFAETNIDNASEGLLYHENVPTSGESFFAFIASGSSESKKALPIEADSSFVVHDNKIYFLQKGTLQVLDIFTHSLAPLSGVLEPSGYYVTDLYIQGNKLWYLLGSADNCKDYKATCEVSLYEMPLEGGQARVLGNPASLTTGSILGFDSTHNILYTQSGWGDGGCFSLTLYGYSYAAASSSPAVSYSHCDGDDSAQQAALDAQYKAIVASLPLEPESSYVRVNAGTLEAPAAAHVLYSDPYPKFIFAQ